MKKHHEIKNRNCSLFRLLNYLGIIKCIIKLLLEWPLRGHVYRLTSWVDERWLLFRISKMET